MSNYLATSKPDISKRELHNLKRVRELASQGMVLLENNNEVLPISKSTKKIALYGNGVRRTVKGGIGYGDVNTRTVITIEQGFEHAGYEITSKNWLDLYDHTLNDARQLYAADATKKMASGADPIEVLFQHPFQEPEIPSITMEDILHSETDTCIYVISRNSGEGSDRYETEGDYYLSQKEVECLTLLGNNYKKLIVILNIGGVIDTKKLLTINGIDAILLMSQAGSMGGDAVVDILCGNVTPSGKLASTWAKNYSDYPFSNEFSHNNGDLDDAYYKEGIYVGYRYFDTFQITPAYCFGHGKSYTTFCFTTKNVVADEKVITVTVEVTNTGDVYSGKEVVQVYFSAPSNKLEKPYQELAAFAKTKELLPGESQILTISFDTKNMASYSEEYASWILEAGSYFIRVGNSSRNTSIVANVLLDETKVTQQLKNLVPLDATVEELSKGTILPYSPPNEEEEKQNAPIFYIMADKLASTSITYRTGHPLIPSNHLNKKIGFEDIRSGEATLDDLIGQLTVEELATLCVGNINEGFGDTSMLGFASGAVPGAAGETTAVIKKERGIPSIVMADGPAGLRLVPKFGEDKDGNATFNPVTMMKSIEEIFGHIPQEPNNDLQMHYQYCTAIPVATLLAQTWDYDVIKECADIVGTEMDEFGVSLWLAPGMNIHRNPLCGRNFEYYSEDPLLSGMCAAADTEGIQAHKGLGTTIKHYAANNQEDNRSFCNSHISERALREIYLKGFEITVKKAIPLSIMSSYNLLNGIHTANHYDLLTLIARDEWGFDGIIMTDWSTTNPKEGTKYPCSSSALCIKAGNDLIMPGRLDDKEQIIANVSENGPLSLNELQFCAKNILQLLLKTYKA